MKILLDNSPQMIAEKADRFSHELWQLRTPLTGYRIGDKPWGLDNGCFSAFDERKWLAMVKEAAQMRLLKQGPELLFVTLPDIVGDAMRTLELFDHFRMHTYGVPRALVLQDGIGKHRIPWHQVDAVFVGGSDGFKTSPEALNAAKAAKMMGKWVHVGRVNTAARVHNWIGLADSIDGSGISRFDHMLADVIAAISGTHPQVRLAI